MPQSRLAARLSAAAALLLAVTAANTYAIHPTPFGASAITTRIDYEPQPAGPDLAIYQGQQDPLPSDGPTVPATSATAAVTGPRTLATAHASLATGILRASASATGGLDLVQASATTSFWETLAFTNTTGLLQLQLFSVTIDGTISTPEAPLAKALFFCTVGNESQGVFVQPGTNTYDFFFLVPAGPSSQYFELSLELTAYREANVDFSHTITVDFAPSVDGVNFSSASGTFLSAVPEPAAATLLLLLPAPLAARRRR